MPASAEARALQTPNWRPEGVYQPQANSNFSPETISLGVAEQSGHDVFVVGLAVGRHLENIENRDGQEPIATVIDYFVSDDNPQNPLRNFGENVINPWGQPEVARTRTIPLTELKTTQISSAYHHSKESTQEHIAPVQTPQPQVIYRMAS